jgi:hypothetical protein
MIAPHPFTPTIYQGAPLLRCDLCARFAGDPLHAGHDWAIKETARTRPHVFKPGTDSRVLANLCAICDEVPGAHWHIKLSQDEPDPKRHAFQPMQNDRQHCQVCRMTDWHTNHIQALPGCETSDTDRETARQLQQAADLTAAMRQPRASISAKAGKMERYAPLFFGTGDNPILF